MLLRTVTDEITQAIAKLSGQEYVDIDARRAKAEMAAGSAPGGGSGPGTPQDGAANPDDTDNRDGNGAA